MLHFWRVMFPFNLGATCDSSFVLMVNIHCISLTPHFCLHLCCNAPARVVSSLSSCFLGMGASQPYVMPWTDQYPSVDTWPERSNRSHPQPSWMPRSTLSLHSCAESVHISVFTPLVSFVPDPGWTLQRTGTKILLSMPFCSEGWCFYSPN